MCHLQADMTGVEGVKRLTTRHRPNDIDILGRVQLRGGRRRGTAWLPYALNDRTPSLFGALWIIDQVALPQWHSSNPSTLHIGASG
jgi:hypothetical protein